MDTSEILTGRYEDDFEDITDSEYSSDSFSSESDVSEEDDMEHSVWIHGCHKGGRQQRDHTAEGDQMMLSIKDVRVSWCLLIDQCRVTGALPNILMADLKVHL